MSFRPLRRIPLRARAGVGVQSLGGTGPIRAGHVPCPDMPSNLNRVGPLADRPAPPATQLADGTLRLAVMRAVRRRVIGASQPDSLPIRWSHPWGPGRRPARWSDGAVGCQSSPRLSRFDRTRFDKIIPPASPVFWRMYVFPLKTKSSSNPVPATRAFSRMSTTSEKLAFSRTS